MPTPDLRTLLNFGENWRHAAVNVARAHGIDKIWTEMDATNKTTPRVEVFFTLGEPTGHRYVPPGEHDPRRFQYDAFWATLTWSVISNRATNGAAHDSLCAAVRALMADFPATFCLRFLPFYALNMAKPQGNREAVIAKDGLDVTQMPYGLHFNVRAEAWPAQS